MKALIIGATGATGKPLVETLLNDDRYHSVVIFVRRPTGIIHPKLAEHQIDFSNIEKYRNLINGDILFSCMGTTLKAAGSKTAQWKIDFDIPMDFARIARENEVNSMVLVSASNANPQSKFFYSRMKGNLEEQLLILDFPQYIIFRPGILDRPDTDRPAEKMLNGILAFFNGIGLLRRYRSLPTPLLAQKLAKAPFELSSGVSKIEGVNIFEF